TGWRMGKWELTADYSHRDEEATSVFPVSAMNASVSEQNTVTHEDVVTFRARNERDRGGSSFNYSWDQYTRLDAGRVGIGDDNSISVSDSERFGPQERVKLNATAGYFARNNASDQGEEYLADLSLAVEHSDRLNTFYTLDYDHYRLADFDSDS